MSIKTRFQDSQNWVMHNPESLVILLIMGTGIGTLCFSAFALALGLNKQWFLMVLFALFAYGALKQFINIVKMVKATSLRDALSGITAAEFVWRRDKNFKKIKDGGVLDGEYCGTEQDITKGNEYNAEGNKKSREQVRGCKEDTQPADPWDSFAVRINESNSKETGND